MGLTSGGLHDNVVLKYPQTGRMRNCKNAISWVPDQLATKAAQETLEGRARSLKRRRRPNGAKTDSAKISRLRGLLQQVRQKFAIVAKVTSRTIDFSPSDSIFQKNRQLFREA
jgi:hypothetical protein